MSKKIKPAAGPASKAPVAVPPSRFLNRDESWLRFNRRVLEEVDDTTNPLLERLKFLAITSSNLDEFIEIRVAGTLQQLEEDAGQVEKRDLGGFTASERLQRLSKELHSFAHDQADCLHDRLFPAMADRGIRLLRWKNLRAADRAFATRYFQEQVDPLLTPVTLDPSHPFPRVLNKALCIALLLRHKRKTSTRIPSNTLGVVTIPRSLPSIIALPERAGRSHFLLLDDLIMAHLEPMFRGYRILNRSTFRVTRNSNLYMEEEESRSVLESVREELHNRRKGDVVRLEIAKSADDEVCEALRSNFDLEEWQVFRTNVPVNLSRFMEMYSKVKLPELKFPEFHGRRPQLPAGSEALFTELRKGDMLLHHPFDSFSTVENFIQSAIADPNVISIKQTLYRTSADSPIFRALLEAAQNREIDVTVVVELMARFDEASNIRWARELEDAGVQVFHGIFGLKTHCKLALLVRRDPDGVIRSYAHLGTGNYNPITARFYTDISLITSRPEITEAVRHVFRYLTADWQGPTDVYRPLLVAPITLADDIVALIQRESAFAREGKPARIIAKMNALLDERTIEALYEASQAGVEIDLIIRGMCSLRPGVSGLSERIRVRSIVGRFLEHSRIFWFQNNDKPEVFAGSADWMQRNLYERCEAVFPISDPLLAERMRNDILETYLRDTAKARLMQPDGSYVRPQHSGSGLSAQTWFMERALGVPAVNDTARAETKTTKKRTKASAGKE
ncbi:MAG: polyphosphate kinase 1 [Acidobacteriaceae bacterium]|nr:polyphosphate kinase 1 [Acidobacteriaceae bacterium]